MSCQQSSVVTEIFTKMPLKIRELPPELLERAMKDINEVPERREADVKHMRDWLKKQPHIRADPDDQTLISFLRGCKFSLERTKEKLDMYYTMRTALPEYFKDRSLKDPLIKEVLQLGFMVPLPEPDEKGRRIVITRMGMHDPSKIKLEDIYKVTFMMMEVMMLEDDLAVVNGIVQVGDMSAMTLSHAVQISPSLTKKTSTCIEEGYPFRLKMQNYLHLPPFLDAIFAFYKSLSKEKVKERLHVHGDLESLYKNVPQRLLPAEYGGQAGTIKEINDAWIKKMESYSAWFEADAKSGVDESKRPGKPKTQQDLFGLEGSFRQLNVD